MQIFLRILFVISLCLLPLPVSASQIVGKVVSIADGDTITVLTEQAQQIKIRLYGIDCPERSQAFGSRARQFTSQVFGKQVSVEIIDVDRYGRKVGLITGPDGTVLNQQLLENGLAWLYPAYCKLPICGQWAQIESAARQARVGLWTDKAPVPPWEYRRGGRASTSSSNSYSATSSGGYTGNISSRIFHSSSCRYYNCKKCTAYFSSREEAIQAGFRSCKICRP